MKLVNNIDKIGTAGVFITALLSPCCFPLFAFGASALGLGSYELLGGWTMWIFQASVIVSVIGLYFSYRKHRVLFPLLLATPCGIFICYTFYYSQWIGGLYMSMFGLLAATIWNFKLNKTKKTQGNFSSCNELKQITTSTLTCPNCSHQKMETMPTDSCQFFYTCENCNEILKPKKGDCCVYCSYGSVPCPPIQNKKNCC